MRVNINLLIILGGFFALLDIIYLMWGWLSEGRAEPVGTVAFGFLAVMSILIGFYLSRSLRAQIGVLPEDRLDSNIEDGDAEVGFFSPWSWWPILLAASAALGFLGFAVGAWIVIIAIATFVIAIVGWVFEYYRGNFAR